MFDKHREHPHRRLNIGRVKGSLLDFFQGESGCSDNGPAGVITFNYGKGFFLIFRAVSSVMSLIIGAGGNKRNRFLLIHLDRK